MEERGWVHGGVEGCGVTAGVFADYWGRRLGNGMVEEK